MTAVVAMTYQLAWLHARVADFSTGNFFSFFTIQANILGVLALALTAIVRREERTGPFDALRAAVTLYLTITGVVFSLLLSGQAEKVDTQLGWVNVVVHYLIFVRAAFLLVGFVGAAAAFVLIGNRRAATRADRRSAGVSPAL